MLVPIKYKVSNVFNLLEFGKEIIDGTLFPSFRNLGEELEVRIEPDNHVDKFAVCVKKVGKIVGHLKKEASGRFAKTIFYFLRSDYYSSCVAKVSGK